ncbi:ABC transporter substrate-binding protein [Mycetocola sp.]|jgi:peptide/nickel transport system substrate-binding protein|uniref:ABC transporter substrate-binding protein n=1 Tax=Mycetocola sp. TaxID=1871042 RepID=UPI00260A5486|nr:ABC transporter substrate-binding protein [Mycetocola sp.]MCU1419020.1 peptide transporter substrate-binding protein [Mycetocola sp.]MCU1561543.1 peptide transporter substrate-binding protein [Mycetocola sp.]
MFRWKRAAAVGAVLALALTGCSAGGSNDGDSASSDKLTLGLIATATTFEAQAINFANEAPYGQAVYDTLLKATPEGEVVENLATEWKYNEDSTVLTLTLRDDVTFTDDTKFDAEAAAQNILRFRDGTSPNKSLLAAVADAKAIDPTTLELTLSQSDPNLLVALTQNAGMVQSPASFENADIKTNPVGSGPYILDTKATVVGSSYEFTKNEDYWNPDSVHYDALSLKPYADPTAMLNALKGGQLNGANTASNNDLAEIEAAGYTVNPFELNWTGLILFDRAGTIEPALGDVRVRQAINYAFDTEALLEAVGQGLGTPTTQIFPTSSVGYDEELDSAYSYDPEKAKDLLAEAGYEDGLTLSMPSTSGLGTTVFTLIGQQLKDVGITVEYTDAGNNFIADILAPKYGSTYMILQQDPDWALINFAIAPTATFNPTKYQDPKVDELIETVHNGSQDESDAAVKELNAYIVDQAWFAPWYRMQSSFVTDAKTDVKTQVGNAYPYLWNFTPKS